MTKFPFEMYTRGSVKKNKVGKHMLRKGVSYFLSENNELII